MSRSLQDVFGRLRLLAAVQTLSGQSDRELLERFVCSGDESAFTVLIERHGPMVYGVCRRSLPHRHDAEDACQATFLVLARKANSLRRKESLGSWLHGVASRVVADLKREAARRKYHEQFIELPPPPDPSAEVSQRENQAVLDEELERLPEWYRAPLILCYLERLPRDMAAARLGLSPGSLHGRLERGRDMLRQRLTKRGLTLSALLAGAAVGEGATLSPTFVVSASKAAALVAAGHSLTELVGAKALTLTREVLRNMVVAKLKLGTAVVLCTALLALVGGVFTSRGEAQDPKAKPTPVAANQESDADFIRRISQDLRGIEPSPAEVHFFVLTKETAKRDKLIDLFIQERQAKKEAASKDQHVVDRLKEMALYNRAIAEANALFAKNKTDNLRQKYAEAMTRMQQEAKDQEAKLRFIDQARAELDHLVWLSQLETIQKNFSKDLKAARSKEEVSKVIKAYVEQLTELQKTQPAENPLPPGATPAKEKQSKNPGTSYYPLKGKGQTYSNYYINPPGTGQPYQRTSPGGPMPQKGPTPSNPGSNGTNLPNNPSPKPPPANSNETNPQGAPPPNGYSNGGTR